MQNKDADVVAREREYTCREREAKIKADADVVARITIAKIQARDSSIIKVSFFSFVYLFIYLLSYFLNYMSLIAQVRWLRATYIQRFIRIWLISCQFH